MPDRDGTGETDRAGPAAARETRGVRDERDGGKPRDPYLDNAKYLTIVLVAVGHAWAPLTLGSRSTSALYYFLYTFHMPTFIIVSGYLSRRFECRPRQIKRLLTGLVVPYLVFQAVFTLFMRWAGDDPEREWSFQEPAFALWFLVALFLWRVTTPIWQQLRWPLPVSVAVGVAASVTPTMSDDLGMMRVAQFLPFFVLGLRLRPEHFEMVRRRAVRILAVPVAAVALAVSYAAVPYISGAPFLHDKDAQSLGLPAWLGAAMTLTSYGCALVMTVCFLAWVPQRGMWFTSLGAGTLGAYLLHVYPIEYAKEMGWFEADGASHPLDRFAITVLAAGMMTLLCTRPVRRALRFVVEPRLRWFFTPEANSGPAAAPEAAGPGVPAVGAPRLPNATGAGAPELQPAPAPPRSSFTGPETEGAVEAEGPGNGGVGGTGGASAGGGPAGAHGASAGGGT
ncbi:acyltransferase family protein [Streptomyces sp. HNM0575]|uniref:acyltransferase family protein n=1 Tax=Streptomyces sp. HNM0575 TaxID=2716338 RepID=UPI003216679F